jgi:hypothetical protein
MPDFPAAVNFGVSLKVFRDSRVGYINRAKRLLSRFSELETAPVG